MREHGFGRVQEEGRLRRVLGSEAISECKLPVNVDRSFPRLEREVRELDINDSTMIHLVSGGR